MSNYRSIKLTDINVGENWSRESEGDITTLKESMRDIGLKQPIIVDRELNLVAGFRRYRAAKELGWTDIDASVLDETENTSKINLIENIERKNLTFYEECVAIKKLFPGYSAQMVADALNRTKGWSRPRINLWKLTPEVIELAKADKLTPTQVTALLASEDSKGACENFAKTGKLKDQRKAPGKKDINRVMTKLMERKKEEPVEILRWVLGDISEEEMLKKFR